jgi:cell division protein ZapA
MTPAEKRSVRVTILGQPYSIVASGDPAEIQQLANSVDELMHEIAKKLPNTDNTRLAVLACLHLADRLSSLERDLGHLKSRVDRKSEELAGLLDRVLESR